MRTDRRTAPRPFSSSSCFISISTRTLSMRRISSSTSTRLRRRRSTAPRLNKGSANMSARRSIFPTRAPFGLSLFSVDSKAAFVDSIDQFVKQMIDGSVSDEAARFVTSAKDEALAEWERHEFYGRAFRDFSVRRLTSAGQILDIRAILPAKGEPEAPDPLASARGKTGTAAPPKVASKAVAARRRPRRNRPGTLRKRRRREK